WQLIRAQTRLARPAIDHRIAESLLVSARLPDRATHQDRAIHADDVLPLAHHNAPPIILHVPLQLDAERPVIPAAVKSAVDFARLENESPPLAQANDLLHPLRVWTHKLSAV